MPSYGLMAERMGRSNDGWMIEDGRMAWGMEARADLGVRVECVSPPPPSFPF